MERTPKQVPQAALQASELPHVRLRKRLRGYDPKAGDNLLTEIQASYQHITSERDQLAQANRRLEDKTRRLEEQLGESRATDRPARRPIAWKSTLTRTLRFTRRRVN